MRGFGTLGLLIGNSFGCLWLVWAIKALAGSNAPVWPAYATALVVSAVAVWRLNRRSDFSSGGKQFRSRPIVYVAIVAGEIVALNLLVYGLQSYGLLSYLLPAIGLVIGVHFFPLARLFGVPTMKLLGTVMVVAAFAAIGAILIGFPVATAVGANALINGVSLLATTVVSRRRAA